MATLRKLMFREHSSGNLKQEYINIKGNGKLLTKQVNYVLLSLPSYRKNLTHYGPAYEYKN
jgi:hypothetical protein